MPIKSPIHIFNGAATIALYAFLIASAGRGAVGRQREGDPRQPTPRDMAAALTDVWSEASLRQPEGPSYEFFRDLLPPLRYVNNSFRHYPVVLSAPAAPVKARWVSNGSAVNARAEKKPMWRDPSHPVHFFVGEEASPFGAELSRLDGPRYAEGCLPVVHCTYAAGKSAYEQEVFAPVQEPWASHGGVFVRFTVRGEPGRVAAKLQTNSCDARDGVVHDGQGQCIVQFSERWAWNKERNELSIRLAPGRSAFLAILTKPLPTPHTSSTEEQYGKARATCIETWNNLLRRGTTLEVPEPIVQSAWRALIIGNFLIANGDRMNYSAGNAYDHLYEAECGDATRSLLLYGHERDAGRMIGPLLAFERQATRYHVAGHKLQLLAHYYWITRDDKYVRDRAEIWKSVAEFIIRSRRTENGLLPRDNYAGDINLQVYSLNSNANCWRGLRDLGLILEDMGDKPTAQAYLEEAGRFRVAILDAVARSEYRDTTPPFIPNALFKAEQPYETLTATRLGSYYDLMAPYIIGSGIFGHESERETWLIEYLQQHGGIAMGMIRSMPHQGEFNQQPGVNVLYGLRYMLALLRRDDRNRALVGFYGQLAQGMTRDTFIGGEGSRFFHGDEHGRSFYLPPNSASNAMFLTTLRYLLIQDWDLDDDGRPETLRLLYGAPGRWLKDGARLRVERAPTMFGEVSFTVESHLAMGEVTVSVTPPPRAPRRMSIRPPLPPNIKLKSARLGDVELATGKDGSVEIPSLVREKFTVKFQVAPVGK